MQSFRDLARSTLPSPGASSLQCAPRLGSRVVHTRMANLSCAVALQEAMTSNFDTKYKIGEPRKQGPCLLARSEGSCNTGANDSPFLAEEAFNKQPGRVAVA